LPEAPAWAAPAFVWGVWGSMLAASLVFIAKYAHNIPFCDDWRGVVPAAAGERPITLGWLWGQELEPPYPLTRLIAVSLVKLTGDFRAPTIFRTLALAALAFAMIRAARGLRGRTSFSDAFFPLALLLWGFASSRIYPHFPHRLVTAWEHIAY